MGWKMAMFHHLMFHRPVKVVRPLKNGTPFFTDPPAGSDR